MIAQLFVNGIVSGCLLALMALGFSLIYTTSKFFHVGHGAVYTVAAYAFYAFYGVGGYPFVLSFVLALLSSTVFGAALEAWIFAPLRSKGASSGAALISSLGIYVVTVNMITILFGSETRLPFVVELGVWQLGSIVFPKIHLIHVTSFVLVWPILMAFLTKSQMGKTITALADNPKLLVVLGTDVAAIRLFVFALGSFLAGLAACLSLLDVGMDPNVGMLVLLNAAVAVIIGNVGRVGGAVLGAFVLEIARNISLIWISARWQLAVTFGILLVFLMYRPRGLLAGAFRVEES